MRQIVDVSDQIEKSVEKSVGLGRRNARHGDLCIISRYQSTVKPLLTPRHGPPP